jgi:hypothetical protein
MEFIDILKAKFDLHYHKDHLRIATLSRNSFDMLCEVLDSFGYTMQGGAPYCKFKNLLKGDVYFRPTPKIGLRRGVNRCGLSVCLTDGSIMFYSDHIDRFKKKHNKSVKTNIIKKIDCLDLKNYTMDFWDEVPLDWNDRYQRKYYLDGDVLRYVYTNKDENQLYFSNPKNKNEVLYSRKLIYDTYRVFINREFIDTVDILKPTYLPNTETHELDDILKVRTQVVDVISKNDYIKSEIKKHGGEVLSTEFDYKNKNHTIRVRSKDDLLGHTK